MVHKTNLKHVQVQWLVQKACQSNHYGITWNMCTLRSFSCHASGCLIGKQFCICSYDYFLEFIFQEIIFKFFLYLFVIIKVDQQKILSSQKKIQFGFQESIFLKNLGGKHFLEVVKNLEMSYYLLIISNLVLKLLFAIYILF